MTIMTVRMDGVHTEPCKRISYTVMAHTDFNNASFVPGVRANSEPLNG